MVLVENFILWTNRFLIENFQIRTILVEVDGQNADTSALFLRKIALMVFKRNFLLHKIFRIMHIKQIIKRKKYVRTKFHIHPSKQVVGERKDFSKRQAQKLLIF